MSAEPPSPGAPGGGGARSACWEVQRAALMARCGVRGAALVARCGVRGAALVGRSQAGSVRKLVAL